MKNAIRIFMIPFILWTAWIYVHSIDILAILIVPTHEYKISFHLFVSSSISSISVL